MEPNFVTHVTFVTHIFAQTSEIVIRSAKCIKFFKKQFNYLHIWNF